MPFTIKAVVFDWAGTLIDFGSRAPVHAFINAFAGFGIEISEAEARAPMGLPKRDHISAILESKAVALQWRRLHGEADSASIDALYHAYLPLNEKMAADHAELIPGVLETVRWLRARNIGIATTTGYSRSIMDKVLPRVLEQGFSPEVVVCADDVLVGRPSPLCVYKCMVELGIHPVGAVMKVDDTPAGLGEGVSAGCVNVGVALSGNGIGKSVDDLKAMAADELRKLKQLAADDLRMAGADHVIDTVADLPALIERLETER